MKRDFMMNFHKWLPSVLLIFSFICLFDAFQVSKASESVVSDEMPMVHKHIFSPEADMPTSMDGKASQGEKEDGANVVFLNQVKRELELTGIVISSTSRKALLHPKKKRKNEGAQFYEAGDRIDSYELVKVSPNYIVLSQNGTHCKLSLFQERKDRPKQLKASSAKSGDKKASAASTNKAKSKSKTASNKRARTKSGAVADNKSLNQNTTETKSADAVDTATPFSDGGSLESGMSADNPFLKAIQKARERQTFNQN